MDAKVGSSQVAWALLTEGVTRARLEAHRIQHLVNRCMILVDASKDKDHIYQVAGDVISAFPKRMDMLQGVLDRTALALTKMGQDFLESRMSLSDKTLVEESVEPSFGKGQPRQSTPASRVAEKYLVRLGAEQKLDRPDVSTEQRLDVLDHLMALTTDNHLKILIKYIKVQINRGTPLDVDQLKMIRNKLYMHRMRAEADLFRVA